MNLGDFINRYRGPLIGLIVSWGAPWHDAIELAEDSFSEAWLGRHRCRGDWSRPGDFGRWLRGVALNCFRSWVRERSRKRIRFVEESNVALDQMASTEATDEQYDELRAAIQRLPEKLRQVVLMHYLEETSVNDVATLLSVSPKTIEGRLYQARRELRRLLDGKTTATNPTVRRLLCL